MTSLHRGTTAFIKIKIAVEYSSNVPECNGLPLTAFCTAGLSRNLIQTAHISFLLVAFVQLGFPGSNVAFAVLRPDRI